MKESESQDGESSTDRTSRRNTLRAMAGAGTTGLLSSLAGCEGSLDKLKPAGQTVAYKTPQGELREGTLGPSRTNGTTTTTTTPDTKPAVNTEQSVASVGNTSGRLSLSPDATEVAYVDATGSDTGTAIVIQSLSGGSTRYSRSRLQRAWSGSIKTVEHGSLKSLDWCPVSGSDRIAVTLLGGAEPAGKFLFEFDRGANTMQLFKHAESPNMDAPSPAWSPSCGKIAYQKESKVVNRDQPLVAFDVSTGEETQRVKRGEDPAWGDTGIAFVRNDNVYLDRQSGLVQLTGSSATDSNPVIFEQGSGESLAFRRDNGIYLIERIDQLGSNPNPSPTKVTTDQQVTTFDIAK